MSKVLVTGAHGQLGREIQKLRNHYAQVYHFTDVEELDLTQSGQVSAFLEELKPDFIVNCAAYTQVDAAESHPDAAMRINRDAVRNLAEAMKAHPHCRLLHTSTDYVFRGDLARPLKEDDPTDPQSVYGRTKLEGERLLEGNPHALIVRTSWLYSAFGKNFVKGMVNRMDARQDLGIVVDQVGSPTYAEDLARALMHIIDQVDREERDFVPGIFHYSNEGLCSWYDLTMEICRMISCNARVRAIETHEYPLPAKRPAYSVFNKNKIRECYGVDVPHWKDSLEKCIQNLA